MAGLSWLGRALHCTASSAAICKHINIIYQEHACPCSFRMWHIAGVWPHLSKGPVLTVPEVVLKRERSGCAVAFCGRGWKILSSAQHTTAAGLCHCSVVVELNEWRPQSRAAQQFCCVKCSWCRCTSLKSAWQFVEIACLLVLISARCGRYRLHLTACSVWEALRLWYAEVTLAVVC